MNNNIIAHVNALKDNTDKIRTEAYRLDDVATESQNPADLQRATYWANKLSFAEAEEQRAIEMAQSAGVQVSWGSKRD